MTTDAPTPAATDERVWPPDGFNPEELPRPSTMAEAIKALRMMAGKHPKNRVLVELRERRDGGALRSGDLRAMADILELWDGTSTLATLGAQNEPARIDADGRTAEPEGNGYRPDAAVSTAHLERVRDALVAWNPDPFTGPAPLDEPLPPIPADAGPNPWEGDPFTSPPAPLDVGRCPDCGGSDIERDVVNMGDHSAPGLARCNDCDRARVGLVAGVPAVPTEPAAPADGGEPLPKGEAGARPATYATPPTGSAPGVGPATLDPFVGARRYMTARSPSQVTAYYECGTRYWLERVERTSEVPAWWNIGGNAFHEAIRWWEFDHAEGVTHSEDETARKFELAFADELAKVVLANVGSNIRPSDYRAARGGLEDRDWWRDNGPAMAADYVTGQRGRTAEVLRLGPDVLALELGFTVDLGGIPVRGFLDQALILPGTGAVVVRDYKTGSRVPDDPLQLQIYAIALRRVFGVDRPIWGAYWRARRSTKREPGETQPVLIDVDDVEPIVAWRVREMDRAERASVYPARPSSFCNSCGVRGLCPVMGPPASRRTDLLVGMLTG